MPPPPTEQPPAHLLNARDGIGSTDGSQDITPPYKHGRISTTLHPRKLYIQYQKGGDFEDRCVSCGVLLYSPHDDGAELCVACEMQEEIAPTPLINFTFLHWVTPPFLIIPNGR